MWQSTKIVARHWPCFKKPWGIVSIPRIGFLNRLTPQFGRFGLFVAICRLILFKSLEILIIKRFALHSLLHRLLKVTVIHDITHIGLLIRWASNRLHLTRNVQKVISICPSNLSRHTILVVRVSNGDFYPIFWKAFKFFKHFLACLTVTVHVQFWFGFGFHWVRSSVS